MASDVLAEAEQPDWPPCANPDCGTGDAGTKRCTRCQKVSYCSATCQRKDWPCHKASCDQAPLTPEGEVAALLKAGRLYAARKMLQTLPEARGLAGQLDTLVAAGIYSEVICGSIELADVPDFGRGYVAARDIRAGEELLFDTAYVAVTFEGKEEFHFRICERAAFKGTSAKRRTDPLIDRQCDFFHDQIMSLSPKDGMDPQILKGSMDEDTQKKMVLCSIAENNCLYCSEDPGWIALYRAASFFNHSCAPNAVAQNSRRTCVVSSRVDIPLGTEITISYLPQELLEDRMSRRERLVGGRGFECRCVRCLAANVAAPAA